MWYTEQSIEQTSGVAYGEHHNNENYNDSEFDYNRVTIFGNTYKHDRRLYNLLYRKSKLESVNETSALLSGFAIVAIVELSLDSYIQNKSSDTLVICYVVVSCLLVGIHLLALLMSMCILPELKSVIRQTDVWIHNENIKPLSSLNAYIETAWVVSTGFGLFLFIIELCLIFWIKVGGISQMAAITAVVTMGFVGFPFILFACGFYFRIARAKVHLHQTHLESIERGAIAHGLLVHKSSIPLTTLEIHERDDL